MKELDKAKALRDYFRRQIAEKNKEISSISFTFPEEIKGNIKYKLYQTFAKGRGSFYDRNESNLNFEQAVNYTNDKKKKEPAYNYFDLDTLIAYDMYLNNVIAFLYDYKLREGRKYTIIKDFNKAMDSSALYSINNAGTFSSGFYNLKCPVKIMRDERGMPRTESTLSQIVFDKRYKDLDFDKLLMEYLDNKYHIYGDKKEQEDENVDVEYFEYKGIKFRYITRKIYCDENMSPIKYVEAESLNGMVEIRGFFDFSMNVYNGDIYDTEGNFVYSREESGVDEYNINMEHNK